MTAPLDPEAVRRTLARWDLSACDGPVDLQDHENAIVEEAPDTVAHLLDALEAVEAENERLRAAVSVAHGDLCQISSGSRTVRCGRCTGCALAALLGDQAAADAVGPFRLINLRMWLDAALDSTEETR